MAVIKKTAKWAALAAFFAGLVWVATTLPDRRQTPQSERDRLWNEFQSQSPKR